jgi:hypothetical protein
MDPNAPDPIAVGPIAVYRRLRETLIECFQASGPRDRLIRGAKLDPGERPAQGTVRDDWDAALQVAIRTGKLDGLLALAIEELPANGDLRDAVAAWQALTPAEQAAAAPHPAVSPARSRADSYAQVSLPSNLVPRPELLASVRAELLGKPGMLALHGMGGTGKSVLARALCDDPEIQAAFPDGILWATIGQTPDLEARFKDWIGALGGVIGETSPGPERLKVILADLLRERACLLILDDVWQKDHVECFDVGGPRCRLLLTTRDAALVEDLGGRVHPVPLMAESEAVSLLELWAGAGLRTTTPDLKSRVVRRLGRLPLAIKLAGAQLRYEDALDWLRDFDVIEVEAERVETDLDSLKRTIVKSLNALAAADRGLYVALAIFRGAEPITVAAVIRLWSSLAGLSRKRSIRLLRDLSARALLQAQEPAQDTELQTVIIHDLLRDFMLAELGPERLLAMHRALLDAYRATQQGDGWHTAPDDGYLYGHLTYHLDALADTDPAAQAELNGLFASPVWLQARAAQSGYLYDGYLADLATAWGRAYAAAGQQTAASEEASGFAECMRYALIRTSINSLAASYEPALIFRAVELGYWPARRGLSVAARVPAAEQRSRLYAALLNLPGLSPAEREEAAQRGLAAARAIAAAGYPADALAALAPHLSGEVREQALAQGLAAAQAIGDEWGRARALAVLAPQLTGELLAQGLAAAQAIGNEWYRAWALAALAPQLTGELLAQGLAAARAIGNEWYRAWALAALAPQLTGTEREQALSQGLAAAQGIEDAQARARVLTALAPQLSGVAREQALAQGLAAARAIGDERSRASALTALALQLSGVAREQALAEGLAAAQAIEDEAYRAEALAALAPQLSGAAREQALAEGLAAAQAIEDEAYRAEALAAFAPQLTGDLLAQGLAAVQTIGAAGPQPQTWALAAFAPRLTGDLLTQQLAVARAIEDGRSRAEALAALAPQLSGAAREQALAEGLAAAMTIEYEWDQAQALDALAPQLTGDLLAQGLAAARAIGDERSRAAALAALALQPTGELLARGPVAAQAVEDAEDRTRVLAAAQAVENAEDRARLLAALAPQLSGALLAQGLAAAQGIRDEWDRARVLAAFIREGDAAAPIMLQVRGLMLDHVYRNLSQQSRSDLLSLCADKELFRPPILSPATLAAIAAHIIDICQWEWL